MFVKIFTRLLAICSILLTSLAWPQSYPNHVVRIILPYPPGGSMDALGRMVFDRLSHQWFESAYGLYRCQEWYAEQGKPRRPIVRPVLARRSRLKRRFQRCAILRAHPSASHAQNAASPR